MYLCFRGYSNSVMDQTKKLGSYPSVLIAVSLTVALFLIAFCGWIAVTSREVIRFVKENVEVQAYLNKEVQPNQIDSLKEAIGQLSFVLKQDSKPLIRFISKKEAADLFIKDSKEDYRLILQENPFRDAFSIRIEEAYFHRLPEVKSTLEKVPGVYEVNYAQAMLVEVTDNIHRIYLTVAVIVLIFLFATILLINNTIRLALHSQRFLIRTMQLVGATDYFIKKPYIVRSVVQGVVASIIALGLLFTFQQVAVNQIPGLSLVQNYTHFSILAGIVLLLGALLGFASTYQAMSRYLRMDLDELN